MVQPELLVAGANQLFASHLVNVSIHVFDQRAFLVDRFLEVVNEVSRFYVVLGMYMLIFSPVGASVQVETAQSIDLTVFSMPVVASPQRVSLLT